MSKRRPLSERRGRGWILHRVLRWSYARWVQILAHMDLLGRDGRPSASKLAAFTVLTTGCACAIYQVTHGPPPATEAGAIGAATVTLVLAGLAASFGIRTFNHFLDRAAIGITAAQLDETKRAEDTKTLDATVRTIDERRKAGNLEYEVTP